MAEQEPTLEQLEVIAANNEECTPQLNYKPPAQKSLREIQDQDPEDESLRKYKQTLLGDTSAVCTDPDAPNVQVIKMSLVCEDAECPLDLDLTGDLEKFKKSPFVLKEGVEYRIKIMFKVGKEIVSGLRYTQTTSRKGLKVDKLNLMVGSYGPKPEAYEYLTPVEEAPKGMLARGNYTIKSKFTDDDNNDHLSWEWSLDIKKSWKE